MLANGDEDWDQKPLLRKLGLEFRSSQMAVFCVCFFVIRIGVVEAKLAAFLGCHFPAVREPKHPLDRAV